MRLLDKLCVHVIVRCVAQSTSTEQNDQITVPQEVHGMLEACHRLRSLGLYDGPLVLFSAYREAIQLIVLDRVVRYHAFEASEDVDAFQYDLLGDLVPFYV